MASHELTELFPHKINWKEATCQLKLHNLAIRPQLKIWFVDVPQRFQNLDLWTHNSSPIFQHNNKHLFSQLWKSFKKSYKEMRCGSKNMFFTIIRLSQWYKF